MDGHNHFANARLVSRFSTLLTASALVFSSGCSTPSTWIKEKSANVSPTIIAIYRYREDFGMWPRRLQELVPDYIQQSQLSIVKEWQYDWFSYSDDQPPQLRLYGPYHTIMIYRFPAPSADKDSGWHVSSEGSRTTLNSIEIVSSAHTLSSGQPKDTAGAISQLQERIRLEPGDERHAERLRALQGNKGERQNDVIE